MVAVAWLLSLLLVAWLAHSTSGGSAGTLQDRQALAKAQQQIEQLSRQQATAQASDRISRAALTDVQASLAEREEEIAGLRADVAFYERLVDALVEGRMLPAFHRVRERVAAAGDDVADTVAAFVCGLTEAMKAPMTTE